MTFAEWKDNAIEHVRKDGWITGGKQAANEFYLGMWRQTGKRWNYGRRIYNHDWDLLVVLDACRADLMGEVVDEYDFVTDGTAYSCGSSSGEWTKKNFSDEYAQEKAKTALVSANPYTDMHLNADDFLLLDEVYKDAFDREVRTTRAETVVDRTIEAYREHDPDRIIAHLMQPHPPFVPDPLAEGLPMHDYDHTPWDTVWDQLRKGDISKERAWTGYTENLRYALDNVAVLLDNVDAERAIITADHGNLLGEFGLYAHPQYVPIPSLKRVPWIETSAADSGSHTPADHEITDVSPEEQLEALGYR